MKTILISLCFFLFSVHTLGQATLTTAPPLSGGNGGAGITFEIQSNAPILITELSTWFTFSGTAEVWLRPGGVQHTLGQAPYISAANGWVQHWTDTISTFGMMSALPNWNNYTLSPNQRLGVAIFGTSMVYSGSGSNVQPTQPNFSDGTLTIFAGVNQGYGGGGLWLNHVRQFNGSITYIDLTPCSISTTPVNAIASDSLICINNQVQLDLVGATAQYGETYQWEKSMDGGINWTTMVNDTLMSVSVIPTDTTQYRCVISCSGQSVTSTVVTVNTEGSVLSGTYTIDPSNPTGGNNFNSFTDFSSAISCGGISGPLTINVLSGNYNEQITLNGWPGASANDMVTIQSAPSNTSPVRLNFDPTSAANNFTIRLNDVSFLKIKNLTLSSTDVSTSYSTVVSLEGSINQVYFDSVEFIGPHITSANPTQSLVQGLSNLTIDFISWENCRFISGSRGVDLPLLSTSPADSIVFINNSFNVLTHGVFIQNIVNFTAIGNDIETTGGVSNNGIYIRGGFYWEQDSGRAIIRENNIRLHGINSLGIYINRFSSPPNNLSEVINNMVYHSDQGTGNVRSLYSYQNSNMRVLHNTFHIEAGNASSKSIHVSSMNSPFYSSGNIDVRNNIFTNFGPGSLAYIDGKADEPGYFSHWDNNLFYGVGSSQFYYQSPISNFSAWKLTTGFDSSSVERSPFYAYPGDLHVLDSSANDIGDNSVNVLYDMDGDTRPYSGSSTVDIGADEYNPFTCFPPVNIQIHSISTQSATINWSNNTSLVAQNILIEFGPEGFSPGTGSFDTVSFSDTTVTLGSLVSETTYDIYITQVCSNMDTSYSIGPFQFTTACGLVVAPYTVSFDSVGWIPLPQGSAFGDQFGPCWTRSPNNGYMWKVRSQPSSTSTGPIGDHTTGSANYLAILGNSGFNGSEAIVQSPFIDISSLTDPEVSFFFYAFGGSMPDVYFEVWDGTSWNVVDSLSGQYQSSANEPWIELTYNLYNYPDTVQLRWRSVRTSCCAGGDFAIDDVKIGEAPPCQELSFLSLSTSNYSGNSIDVNWTPAKPNATTWEIEYGPVGFAQGTGTVLTVNGPLPITVSGLAEYTEYEFYVREACVAVPGVWSSWIGPVYGTTAYLPPYLENFSNWINTTHPNGQMLAPFGWETMTGLAQNPSIISPSFGLWQVDGFENNGLDGAARINMYSSSQYWLVSPPIDLGNSGNWELFFDGASTSFNSTSTSAWASDDSLLVLISLDNGQTWNRSDQLFVFDSINPLPLPGQKFGVPLANYFGTVRFAFYAESIAGGPGSVEAFIDNFEINTPPACPNISSLHPSGVTSGSSIEIGWTNGSMGANSWEVEYGPSGFTKGTGSVITANTNPFVVSGLTPITAYDFYVREQCSNGVDFSNWVGYVTDTTVCGVFQAPWTASFDVVMSFSIPQCWETQSPSNPQSSESHLWRSYAPNLGGSSPSGGVQNTADHTGVGGGYLWVDASLPNYDDLELLTPFVDVSNLEFSPAFECFIRSENADFPNDNVTVIFDVWDGSAWNDSVLIFQDDSVDWFHIFIPLDTFNFTGPLQVRITVDETTTVNSAFYNDILVDDISILENLNFVYDSLVVCDSLTWIDGITYYQDTSFTDTVYFGGFITQIVSLDLTVHQTKQDSVNRTVCSSYTAPWGQIITQSGIYQDTLTSQTGCDSIIVVDLVVQDYQPEICLVSLDSALGMYPQVVWEKPTDISVVDSFYISREFGSNVYQTVGVVHRDSISLFVDSTGLPYTGPHRYKIGILDTCGDVRALSDFHQSIYLEYLGLGEFQWSEYEVEGTTGVIQNYNIYRDSIGTGDFQILASLPALTTSYTDLDFSNFPNAKYRVEAIFTSNSQCIASVVGGGFSQEVNSNVFSSSYSNIISMSNTALIENKFKCKVFPNPTNNVLNIEIKTAGPQSLSVQLVNSQGQVVYKEYFNEINGSLDTQLNLSKNAKGVYNLRLYSENGVEIIQVVLQ